MDLLTPVLELKSSFMVPDEDLLAVSSKASLADRVRNDQFIDDDLHDEADAARRESIDEDLYDEAEAIRQRRSVERPCTDRTASRQSFRAAGHGLRGYVRMRRESQGEWAEAHRTKSFDYEAASTAYEGASTATSSAVTLLLPCDEFQMYDEAEAIRLKTPPQSPSPDQLHFDDGWTPLMAGLVSATSPLPSPSAPRLGLLEPGLVPFAE